MKVHPALISEIDTLAFAKLIQTCRGHHHLSLSVDVQRNSIIHPEDSITEPYFCLQLHNLLTTHPVTLRNLGRRQIWGRLPSALRSPQKGALSAQGRPHHRMSRRTLPSVACSPVPALIQRTRGEKFMAASIDPRTPTWTLRTPLPTQL